MSTVATTMRSSTLLSLVGFDTHRWSTRLDMTLLVSAILLMVIGFIMIASASMDFAELRYNDAFFFVQRHGIYALMGLSLGAFAFFVPLRWWEDGSVYLLLASFALLLVILLPGVGRTVNGATRWLALGPFTLQGSEFAKIAVVMYIGGYLVRQQDRVTSHWTGFFNPMAVMTLMIVLLLLEPDFGAVVVLLGSALGMLFLGGVRLWQFIILIMVSAIAIAVMAVSSPYRMQRLTAFADPWADQFNTGYQLTQSLIAFGRGEWFGLGLGNSIQKLFYLPEAHTDFVFAILAEEWGFIGCILTLAIYAVFVGRILFVGRCAESEGSAFSAYVAYGIALIFSAQLFINVGVNTGLLPTKGLTLPLISYGGSSLLVSCVLIAVVMRIHYELKRARGAVTEGGRGH